MCYKHKLPDKNRDGVGNVLHRCRPTVTLQQHSLQTCWLHIHDANLHFSHGTKGHFSSTSSWRFILGIETRWFELFMHDVLNPAFNSQQWMVHSGCTGMDPGSSGDGRLCSLGRNGPHTITLSFLHVKRKRPIGVSASNTGRF